MRLSLKLALVFALYGAAIAVGFQYSRVRSAREEMYSGQRRTAEVALRAVKGLIETSRARGGDYAELRNALREMRTAGIASVVVKDRRGRWVVWRSDPAAAQRRTHPGLPISSCEDGYYDVETPVDLGRRGPGVVQVSFPMALVEEHLKALEADAVRVGVMAFLTITLGAWILGAWFGLRLERLVPNLESLSRDPENFRPVRPMSSGDELSRLVAAFNRMGETLRHETLRRRVLEREKVELSAMLVHDLKTPLTVIHSGISLLQDQLRQDGGAAARRRVPAKGGAPEAPMGRKFDHSNRRTFELLKMSADRLHRMVEDVLQLARLEEVEALREVRATDMTALARACAKDFELIVTERRLTIQLDCRIETGGEVQGDPTLLRRVLDNLVHNAVEHTPAGGTITIGVAPAAGGVRVEVSDSGPGIPPEARADIFHKFFQKDMKRHVGNVGLGLALCHKAVARHGGSIGIEDAQPKGAKFFFVLPARPVEAASARS